MEERYMEIFDKLDERLTRMEGRDAVYKINLDKMASYLSTLKWAVGILLLPTLAVLIDIQIKLSNVANKDEIDEKYVHREQVSNAFSYTADQLYYSIKTINDSVNINTYRPYILDMSTIKAILNSRQ